MARLRRVGRHGGGDPGRPHVRRGLDRRERLHRERRRTLKDFSAWFEINLGERFGKIFDTRLEILCGRALIGRENCGRGFSSFLPRSIYSGFISLRKQPIDVPPNDLIAWTSPLFELSAFDQCDLTAMALQEAGGTKLG